MPSSSPSLQWLSLVATIWLQSINAPNSDFPIYSSQLKTIFSISQIQLNNLAFASDAGKILGFISGIAANYFPLRLVLLVGATFGFLGYGIQFLFLENNIPHLSYWHVFFLTALAGNGICWINTVCYITCARNFPGNTRVAAGISTSYVGLSARVYVALADSVFNQDVAHKVKGYILLNAVVPVIISLVSVPIIHDTAEKKDDTWNNGFVVLFVVALLTGVCAVFGSVGSSMVWVNMYTACLGILLFCPVIVPMMMKYREKIQKKMKSKESRVHVLTVEEVEAGERGKKATDLMEIDVEMEVEGNEVGFSVLVRKLDFWLYFFSYMFGATLGLVYLNNLGQIAESRRISNASALVSLVSSSGFLGRISPPVLDYYLSHKKNMISRPAFMAVMMGPMALAFIILLNSGTVFLFIGTTIIGLCSGAITSIAVSATYELFGMKNFAVNHNLVVTNIPIGSFLFGYFAARLYEKAGESEKCLGSSCYYHTFIIWAFFSSVGTLLCTILYVRTRKLR